MLLASQKTPRKRRGKQTVATEPAEDAATESVEASCEDDPHEYDGPDDPFENDDPDDPISKQQLGESRWMKAHDLVRDLQELDVRSYGMESSMAEARMAWKLVGQELQTCYHGAGQQMPFLWMTDDQILERAAKAKKH